MRAIDIRRIDPAAAGLQHVHDAADNPPVIDPRLASRIGRQKWGEPRKLIFRQPETIAIYRRPPVGDRESHIRRQGNLLWVRTLGQFAVIQAVAPSLGLELSSVNARNAPEIEDNVMAFLRSGNGGLVATASALMTHHREQIIALAARNKLPAVYNNRVFVVDGGLISYGVDLADQFRRAAVYVDRILKGEKPADLPVQAPTKYELAINLKTAKALGLTVPPTLLARADEVIE